METWEATDQPMRSAARELADRLGAPTLGIVFGSGFAAAASGLGDPVDRLRIAEIAGLLAPRVDGHDVWIASYEMGGARVWVFEGRLHLYEGHSVSRVAQAVRVLSLAGARAVLLTCSAGGLREGDAPGDLLPVEDHVNLTGVDPVAAIPPDRRDPPFPDLQGMYDRKFLDGWIGAAGENGISLRPGVLVGVSGPCYETPAEVRMLRALGADAVTMSTIPEAIVARYLGLRISALACIANPGAGMGAGPLRHRDVLAAVSGATARLGPFFRRGIAAMLEATAL